MNGLELAWLLRGVPPFDPRPSFRRVGYGKTRWNPQGFHVGVDLACGVGTIVAALRPGVITWTGRYSDLGLMVVSYDRWLDQSFGYCHLSSFGGYDAGDAHGAGAGLARSGNTGNTSGPHLHLFATSGRWVPREMAWGALPYTDPRPLVMEAVRRAA